MNTQTEQQILSELRELDPLSLRELLDFLAFLRYRQQPAPKPTPRILQAGSGAFEIYAQLDLGAGGNALQPQDTRPTHAQLTQAAQRMLDDYRGDEDLTSFTALLER